MVIPKVLYIGTQTIKVTLKPLSEIDSDCSGGWARWEQNELIIANDIPEDRQFYLFWHEVLHFINVYFSEKEATYLAECICQVLKDNDFVK